MPDFNATRSEYLRIMMGNTKDALAPYRPEQMNDLGDTSFDAAMITDGADLINAGADLQTSLAIAKQRKKQRDALEQEQTQPQTYYFDDSVLRQEADKGEWWQQVFGLVDNGAASWGTGWTKAYEGMMDIGAGIVSTIADWAGNKQLSSNINNWIKKDLSANFAQWTKTFANFTPWAIISNATNGRYGDKDYWLEGLKTGADIFTFETTNLHGDDDMTARLRNDTAQYYDFQDGYRTELGNFIGGVVQSLGTVVASIYGMPNIAGMKQAFGGSGTLGNKAINLIPFAVSASGTGMEEALNDGAKRTDQALAYGFLAGNVEAGTELASVGLEKIPGVGKIFTGDIHGLSSKGVKVTTSRFLANMFQEGFEEVESDLLNPLIKTVYKGSDALNDYNTGEYWLNVGKDFAAGAVSGGIMSGVQGAAQKLSDYKNAQAEAKMVAKIKADMKLSSDEAARAVLANAALAKAASQLAVEYQQAAEAADSGRMTRIQQQVAELAKTMEQVLNNSALSDEDRRIINLKYTVDLDSFAKDIGDINNEVKAEIKAGDTSLPAFEDVALRAKNTVEAPTVVVKEAAQSREGKVYTFSSVKSMTNSVRSAIAEAFKNAGVNAEVLNPKTGNFNKNIFDAINLGTEADKARIREYFRNNILNTNVKVEGVDGTKTTASLDSLATAEMKKQIAQWTDEAFDELLANGKTSVVSKLVSKIQQLVEMHQETKNKGNLHGKIQRRIQRLVKTYGHANAWINQSGEYDFDNKGFQVLVAPFSELKGTSNEISFTGRSVLDAFTKFLDKYKAENYQTKNEVANELVASSELWNQALHDLATRLVESIENENAKTIQTSDKDGNPITKVQYNQLNAGQLYLLMQMVDIVRDMPSRSMEDRLQNRSNAIAAQNGIETYLTKVPGAVRKFVQGYSERFASQTDTFIYEIGDNQLSKLFYHDLVLNAALRDGAVNDIEVKTNDYRKKHKITESKLNRKSSVVKDSKGRGVELRYVEALYRHLLSGAESNNVKYIRNDSMYVLDEKMRVNHIIHFEDFADEDIARIKAELKENGLLGYSEYLHGIDNGELKNVYDEDYLRDFHVANSNSLDNYTQIVLYSNTKNQGASQVKNGVSNKNYQIDRVTNIPKGCHLVLADGQHSIISNAKALYNTHFLDPVLKDINGTLNSPVDGSKGKNKTVLQYLTEHQMEGAKKLMERMVYGAYDVTPSELKAHPFIDGFSNGWVMYVLGLNPSTVLKQPVSIMWSNDIKLSSVLKYTVAANISPKAFRNTNRLVKEIESEFPSLKLRKGRNEALRGNTPKEIFTKAQAGIAKVAGFGINWADRWTVAHEAVGLLAYQGQSLGYGEIGTAENDQYVKSHYIMFYQTQVSSNKIQMSGARRGYYGGLGKILSLFTGPAQGQVGYMLRGMQQISQFKGKTFQFFENEIGRAKAKEATAKLAYEEAGDEFVRVSEDASATADDIKEAHRNWIKAFDEYSYANGFRQNVELQAKSFRHYKDIGGAKGVVVNRLGSAVVSGVYLSLVALLIQMLKGKHEWKWEDEDLANLAKETALNSFVSWIPVVRTIKDMLSGYELEIPEYIAVKQLWSTVQAIVNACNDMSEKNTKAMWRDIIKSISMALGIPSENIYNYLYGILKVTNIEAAIALRNAFYGVSNNFLSDTIKNYVEANDMSSAAKYIVYQYQMYKTGDIEFPVAVELAKLMREGFNAIARNIPDYFMDDDGNKITLSEDQKVKFKNVYSAANRYVAKLIRNSNYDKLETESRAKAIKKIYDAYYEAAKYESLGIEPTSRLGKLIAYCGGDYDVAQAVLLIQQNAQLVDTKRRSKKEQAVLLVNRQPMSRAQKLLTLSLMGYGIAKENKRLVTNYLVSLGFSKDEASKFIS